MRSCAGAGGMPRRAGPAFGDSEWRPRSRKTKRPKPEAPAETPDGPLLDLSDAAVKKMIKVAKKRGYVTMTS